MKFKSILTTIFIFLMLTGSAYATGFSIDMSSLGLSNLTTGSSTLEITDNLLLTTVLQNYTTIDQSFGADGILNDTDTFTEFGFLNAVTIDGMTAVSLKDTGGNKYYMYFEFDDLEGEILNYDSDKDGDGNLAGNTTVDSFYNVADDYYDLTFYAGVGSISIYIDNDFDSSNGVLSTIATLSVASGEGSSPELVNGSETTGNFNITMDFETYTHNMWSLIEEGMLFEDYEAIYGNSAITMLTQNIDATVKTDLETYGDDTTTDDTDDGFTVGVLNQGSVYVSAVPEPTTLLLLGFGLIGMSGVARKRRNC